MVVGKTAAFLDFANPIHAGKQPGEIAVKDSSSRPTLALMLIGARCFSRMSSLELEYKNMGDVIAQMVEELRAAPPEDDTGFLCSENYLHAKDATGNGNAVRWVNYTLRSLLITLCVLLKKKQIAIYWRSYQHIWRFAHKANGSHYPAWDRYMKLQKESHRLGTELGIWHEIFEVSNAEGIYHNMPRTFV